MRSRSGGSALRWAAFSVGSPKVISSNERNLAYLGLSSQQNLHAQMWLIFLVPNAAAMIMGLMIGMGVWIEIPFVRWVHRDIHNYKEHSSLANTRRIDESIPLYTWQKSLSNIQASI